MRTGVPAVLLAVLLAGCLRAPAAEPGGDAMGAAEGGETPPAEAGVSWVPLPDEQALHLLRPPAVAGAANATQAEVPVPPALVPTGGSLEWTFKPTAAATVAGGSAEVWVRVERDTVVPAPGIDGQFCPWSLALSAVGNGRQASVGVRCPAQADPRVPAGLHHVRFDLGLLATYPQETKPGDTWTFGFTASLATPDGAPAATVLVGGGTGSRVTLVGLREPFPPPPRVRCLDAYPLDVRRTATLDRGDYGVAGAAAGVGMTLPVARPEDLRGVEVEVAWEATQDATRTLRAIVTGPEFRADAEGPSPLRLAVPREVARDAGELYVTLYPSEGSVLLGPQQVAATAHETLACPPPG